MCIILIKQFFSCEYCKFEKNKKINYKSKKKFANFLKYF